MQFSKWEGLGNDFVVVAAEPPEAARAAAWARLLCDRHFGVGADGLVFFPPPAKSGVKRPPLEMIIYNSDGSLAQMCGNALRCLGAVAHQQGRAGTFQTGAGPRPVKVIAEANEDKPWLVEVDMGSPQPIESPGPEGATLVSMGNPHCVFLHPAPENWQQRAAEIQRTFADGINVEYVEMLAPRHMVVKVYERGAGATMACGTGACAALVAARQAGAAESPCKVELPGGTLEIEWEPGQSVKMRGPAREVFTGVWKGELP